MSKIKKGRPSKLSPELTRVICDAIRLGGYIETAVAYAGLSKETFYQWMKRGAKELERREKVGKDKERDYEITLEQSKKEVYKKELQRRRERDETDKRERGVEEAFVVFSDSIKKATSESELSYLGVIAKAARGGLVIGRTTTTSDDGSTHVVEKFAKAEWTAAAWALERRNPEKWGRRQVELVGNEGGPLELKLTWADAIKETFAMEKEPEVLPKVKENKLLLDANSGEEVVVEEKSTYVKSETDE